VYISQFQIWNYKSFRETEAITLSRGMNIVTGQNNVGKTALLEALSLMFAEVPHKSITTRPLPTTLDIPVSKIGLTVVLSQTELLTMLAEQDVYLPLPAGVAQLEGGTTILDRTPGSLKKLVDYFFSRTEFTFRFWLQSRGVTKEWLVPVFPSFGMYETNRPPDQYAQCRVHRNHTVSLTNNTPVSTSDPNEIGRALVAPQITNRIFRFGAQRSNAGTSDFGSRSVLTPEATNLPEVLLVLQGNPGIFDHFNRAVREVLPKVAGITVVPNGNQLKILVWSEPALLKSRQDLAFGLNESGSGIGQVLGILYVALASQTPQVILIDEPQSFLHPGAARKLIEVLKGLKEQPQHQYVIATHSPTIITAAKPETIMLVTHDGNESHIQRLDANDADHLRRYLDEIGASLADVFGADNILWVEGITEEKCYPMIVEKILKRSLMGTVIKAVIATGDFEGRHAERFFEIYERLSAAQSLLPPALGFIFDDDGRSESDKNILRNRGKDRQKNQERVYFTKRLMYENYLLHPKAITEVLNATEGHSKTVTEADVQACIDKYLADPGYYKKLEPSRSGIEWIRADLLLKKVFAEVAGLDYRKTTHSIELTEWLLTNDPEKLTDVADVIRAALG
jgi:hypothetical protein